MCHLLDQETAEPTGGSRWSRLPAPGLLSLLSLLPLLAPLVVVGPACQGDGGGAAAPGAADAGSGTGGRDAGGRGGGAGTGAGTGTGGSAGARTAGAGGAAGQPGAGGGAGAMDGGARDAAGPGDASNEIGPVTPGSGPMPPPTWKEHWFDHTQDLALFEYDEHAAIYVDGDVNRQQAKWLLPWMSQIWQYTKKTYGDGFGPDLRLFSIHHQGRYGGGHPSYYFDASHDNRNVSDCGPGPWDDNAGARDMTSHEVAHVVESANNGAQGSPSFPIWMDSKWAEIYQYDLYLALGRQADAQRVFNRFNGTSDGFPRPGTRWFRDWFYPLWKDHGGSQLMPRYFKLVAQHFSKRADGKRFARDLNFGEYVHFTSGAAGKDLKALATAAFGWPAEREAQFQKARTDFPMVTYAP